MPRLRQNERKLVQAGMTHKAVEDDFRITISRLVIRLRQTGRTNDRPRNGRPGVTSQRQDRQLRLIYLRNRTITAEDIPCRTPGLANVRISGQTVRIRLRKSGFRVMNPDFHFVAAMDDIVCTAGVMNVLRTSVCTSPTVLETEVLWSGLKFFMMVALS